MDRRDFAYLRMIGCCLIGIGIGIGTGIGTALAQTSEPKEITFPDPPPKPPATADQIEYFTVPDSRNRYWLDLASLAVGENQTIRFSTVLVSESGVRNVRHEAFKCASSERRLLAIGRTDGSWSVTPEAPWQPIRLGNNTNLGYPELFRALCFGGANADANKVSEKLRTGLKVGNF
jgi:CNP1-like family